MPGPTSLATAFASAPSVAPAPRGFAELDERIAAASPGVVLVRAPKEISLAVLAHVVRRVQSISLNALVASIREGAPLFRDAAVRLGVGSIASTPDQISEQIAGAASEKRTVLIGRLPERGSWDAAVLDELTRKNAFAVFVTESETEIEGTEVFTVGAHLDGDERARWWSAVADEADALVAKSDWNALTHWWETARRTPATPPAARPALSAGASKLLAAFALVACPWSALRVSMLGPAAALDELVDVGAVSIERGLAVVSEGWLEEATRLASAATLEERRAAAHALLSGPEDGDPWAFARAAELLLGAGEAGR